VVGRNMLMGTGAGAEEVTQLIVASTEALSRSWALEPTHRLVAALDAAVILLQSVVEIAAGAMLHGFTQCRPDRAGIAVVAIRGHPVRGDVGDCLGGLEERFRGGHVAVFAEHHVDQRAAAVNGAIKIAPVPVDFDVGLVDVPAAARLAASATAQTFSQCGREFGFPVANRLMAEYDAADQEHLWKVAQAELVAQSPEHDERDDVGRILGPVQQARTALIELFAARAAAKSAVALSGTLVPFRNGCRAAPNAPHLSRSSPAPPLPSPFPSEQTAGASSDGTLKVPREFLTPEIWQGLIEGWYECEELDEIAAVLRPNDVVLELGTGLGFISTFVARQPGIRRIVSIEANPKLVDIARQNHALNGARVEMINAVAASKDGTSHFCLHDDFWTSSMTPQPGTTVIELPARSISGLLADIKPSVLIVDIEGGEASIFDGVDLSTVRDAILEVHPDVIGLEGVSRVFAHMAATGLLYNPRLSSRAIVVFSRCG
jgi:FkbM family methyltransferase